MVEKYIIIIIPLNQLIGVGFYHLRLLTLHCTSAWPLAQLPGIHGDSKGINSSCNNNNPLLHSLAYTPGPHLMPQGRHTMSNCLYVRPKSKVKVSIIFVTPRHSKDLRHKTIWPIRITMQIRPMLIPYLISCEDIL